MKSGAIFDMDGLLFDTEILYNNMWGKVAETYGLKLNGKMLDEMRGTGREAMYKIINRYWPTVDAPKIREELFEEARKELLKNVPIKQGVIEILEYLKNNGVRLAVASGSPLESVKNNLKVARIDSYFDVVVSGEQVSFGKPAPDIFLLAASKLGLGAEDCYVFEDAPNGVYAGVKAGCKTIMIPDMLSPTEDLYEIVVGIYPNLIEALEGIKRGEC